jgi:hypothetical protein
MTKLDAVIECIATPAALALTCRRVIPTLSVDASCQQVQSRAFVLLFNPPQEAAMTHLDLAPSLACTAAA